MIACHSSPAQGHHDQEQEEGVSVTEGLHVVQRLEKWEDGIEAMKGGRRMTRSEENRGGGATWAQEEV